jgi:hypothetical protein
MTTRFRDLHGNPVRMTKVVVKSPDEGGTPFAFFQIGTEYYISARSAAQNVHYQVAGNLFHHAFEMMLKGILLEKSGFTAPKLKERFGHDIPGLWEEAKKAVPSPGRSHPWAGFKRFIDDLHRWEEIRFGEFPGGLPKVLAVDYLSRDPNAKRGQTGFNWYRAGLEDADKLFAVLVAEMGWDQPAFVREKLIGVAAIRDYELWNCCLIGEATYPEDFS